MSKVAYPFGPLPFLNFSGNHASVTPGAQRIGVDLATVMLMYWRVAQWQAKLTLSGAFDAVQDGVVRGSFSVSGATFTSVYAPQYNLVQVTDETQLVLPCDTGFLVSNTSDPGTVTSSNPYGPGTNPYTQAYGPIFAPFAGPGNYPGATRFTGFVDYDPAANLYSPIYDAIFDAVQVGDSSGGSITIEPVSSITHPYAGTFDVPITVTGIGADISLVLPTSLFLQHSFGDPYHPAPVTTPITASIAVTPVLWWSYGGKYDTGTGARL